MAGKSEYKVITGTVAEIETKLNGSAPHGWKVVAMAHLSTNQLAVVIEKAA